MPHIVINGKIAIQDICNMLKPIFVRQEGRILKTMDVYLSQNNSSILVESLTIENRVKKNFLTLINQREDGVVVRLYPMIEIEKTEGVKTILAKLANQIIESNSENLKYGKTNISEFLDN